VKPYVVRRPGWTVLAAVAWLAFLAAFIALTDLDPPVWLVALVVLVILVRTWRVTERFRAGPDGIRFPLGTRTRPGGGGVAFADAPWSSVDEVLVAAPLSGGPPEVAVRLRPGAPLPAGVQGIVHTPGAPEGPIPDALRHTVPGLDPVRLREAVAAFAPHVRLTESAGGL